MGKLSEKAKKLLEASDEGKAVLAELDAVEKAAGESENLREALRAAEAEKKSITDKLIDPEYLSKIVAGARPRVEHKEVVENEPDFDNMSLRELRAYVKKTDLEPSMATLKEEVLKEVKQRWADLYTTIMQREVDEVKDQPDFEGLRSQLESVCKENPAIWPRNALKKARKLKEQLEVAKVQEEKAKVDKAAEDQRVLFTEQPEAAIAALSDKKLTKEDAVKKAIELEGGLPE